MVNVLVLVGYGINCDYETDYAFRLGGAQPERVHVNDLINGKKNLENYQILAIPGGFAYADDVAAGKVLANKMSTNISQQIKKFVDDGKLIIGICNGFQAMVKYPLLPKFADEQTATLTFNDSARFGDRWVYLKVNERSPCIFTKNLNGLYLPVRHAEGKFVVKNNRILDDMLERNQIALQYANKNGEVAGQEFPLNPNGSVMDIAAVCDESGRIFGMMPHPEAYLYRVNHPRWTREDLPREGAGVQIFRNAVEYARGRL